MRKVLKREFFDRPTLTVARGLLGKFLVRKIGKKEIARMITDVEAYVGERDRASHASRGKTKRNAPMFGKAGHWYVYFTYGMHWMLNIVTERKGYPAAILIRGVAAPLEKRGEPRLPQGRRVNISGPARITKFLKIDKRLNNKLASRASGLWIEDRGIKIAPREIARGKRIGVDYAGKWKDKLWRFFLISNL